MERVKLKEGKDWPSGRGLSLASSILLSIVSVRNIEVHG
jgi:hypothetical protein